MCADFGRYVSLGLVFGLTHVLFEFKMRCRGNVIYWWDRKEQVALPGLRYTSSHSVFNHGVNGLLCLIFPSEPPASKNTKKKRKKTCLHSVQSHVAMRQMWWSVSSWLVYSASSQIVNLAEGKYNKHTEVLSSWFKPASALMRLKKLIDATLTARFKKLTLFFFRDRHRKCAQSPQKKNKKTFQTDHHISCLWWSTSIPNDNQTFSVRRRIQSVVTLGVESIHISSQTENTCSCSSEYLEWSAHRLFCRNTEEEKSALAFDLYPVRLIR